MGVTGAVKFFDPDKGYGFIKRDDGKPDVFVHIKDLRKGGYDTVDKGVKLSFEIEMTEKGPRAAAIHAA